MQAYASRISDFESTLEAMNEEMKEVRLLAQTLNKSSLQMQRMDS